MRFIYLLITYFSFSFPLMAQVVDGQSAASTLLVLLAIIALILGIAKVMKGMKLPSMSGKAGIKMISQLPLGQKERILLIEVNGEQLLVGATAQQINLIKKLDSPVQLEEQSDVNGNKKIT